METQRKRSTRRLARQEMRNSFILPVVLTTIIWFAGVLIYAITPDEFNTTVTILIGIGLLGYLVYQTRQAKRGLQLTAVLMALPALAGITLGVTNGRSRFVVIGVGITFLLLILQRFLNTPLSFRLAFRRFQVGDTETALNIIDRSIKARPDFWESYQLRALIHLVHQQYGYAERDARQAIDLKPNAHPVWNTLGQIYLADAQFNNAKAAYTQAVELDPSNALYMYHLGLSLYRLNEHRAAVNELMAAIQATLPLITYDLWAHYYLICSLEALGENENAQTVYNEGLSKFADGLEKVQAQVANQPEYPHHPLIQADLVDLEKRLRETQKNL